MKIWPVDIITNDKSYQEHEVDEVLNSEYVEDVR